MYVERYVGMHWHAHAQLRTIQRSDLVSGANDMHMGQWDVHRQRFSMHELRNATFVFPAIRLLVAVSKILPRFMHAQVCWANEI